MTLLENGFSETKHPVTYICEAGNSYPAAMVSPLDEDDKESSTLQRAERSGLSWWQRVRQVSKSFLKKLSPVLLCRKICNCYVQNMMAWAEEAERHGVILVPEMGINANLSRVTSMTSCGSEEDYRELIQSASHRAWRNSFLSPLDLRGRVSVRMDKIDESSPSHFCSYMEEEEQQQYTTMTGCHTAQ
eukprot:c40357_g1_i1 orf=353-916(+)